MKKSTLSLALVLCLTAAFAQTDKYIKTMEGAIQELYNAQAPDAFDPVINKLTRIGQAEKSQWEPFYYASLGHVFKSFRIQDNQVKDGILDQAHSALDQAETNSPENVEIIALRGFIDMMKMTIY